MAIPNPKTVFAIASFQKQKNLLGKSGNIGSLVDEKTSQTTAKPSTNKRVAKASQQGVKKRGSRHYCSIHFDDGTADCPDGST